MSFFFFFCFFVVVVVALQPEMETACACHWKWYGQKGFNDKAHGRLSSKYEILLPHLIFVPHFLCAFVCPAGGVHGDTHPYPVLDSPGLAAQGWHVSGINNLNLNFYLQGFCNWSISTGTSLTVLCKCIRQSGESSQVVPVMTSFRIVFFFFHLLC